MSAHTQGGVEHSPNLEFVDLMVARMELLMELRTFQRYGVPQAGGETDFAQVVEPLRQQMMAVEQRLAHLREQASGRGDTLPFDRMVQSFGLDLVEEQILMLALAPVLDAAFRKRIARFKDNILLDYVDVDLCLSVLFDTRRERLAAMQWFGEHGRLFLNRVLVPSVPRESGSEHQLGYELTAPGRVVNFVLGRGDIDMAIRGYARLSYPTISLDHVVLAEKTLDTVLSLAQQFAGNLRGAAARMNSEMGEAERGGVLQFVGPAGTGKTHTARAIAAHLGVPVLEVDCGRLGGDDLRFKQALESVFWQARLLNAVLVLDRPEAIMGDASPKLPAVFAEFERWQGLAILTSIDPKKLDSAASGWIVYQFEFEAPEVGERQRLWTMHLATDPPPAESVSIEELATQYEVTGSQIRNACLVAANMALAEAGEGEAQVTMDHLKRAAHTQMRASLSQYARRSKMKLRLDDLILPDDEKAEIQSIIEAARTRAFVMSKWGFANKLSTGKGLVIMFCGEPGTGKTLCAEIMANMLELQLYQISIPNVMSKFIGETEKNIAEIFHTAKANHAMLLFDEADSLFASRVKVESSVDKFSNMETNLLLQEIERFEGVIILTTNLDKSIDKAFQRRIQFKVTFPFPEAEQRAQIWQLLFPKECPLDPHMDWDLLGKSFEISGGHIKNAVLRAAYRAACTTGIVDMETIRFAAEQECKHAGKLFRSFPLDHEDF
ncbi:MAG: SpoVK/Ycf46/Vps4 family AAA+-type ATPase [Myxococcota bacterium]|jgi:SpoVK/Ycf46/Vps4 family AAA+-type ATPase